MIKEIAITPYIFDEVSSRTYAGWTEHLQKLAEMLLPANTPSPFMISDLHGGSWAAETVKLI